MFWRNTILSGRLAVLMVRKDKTRLKKKIIQIKITVSGRKFGFYYVWVFNKHFKISYKNRFYYVIDWLPL